MRTNDEENIKLSYYSMNKFSKLMNNDIIYINSFTSLSTTVNPADPLFYPHRIPREIIVDQRVTKLIVQAFRTNLGKQHNVDCIGIVLLQFESVFQSIPFFIVNTAVNLANTKTE